MARSEAVIWSGYFSDTRPTTGSLLAWYVMYISQRFLSSRIGSYARASRT